MSLKEETARSFVWNFLDKVGYQAIALAVGLVTLRILTPTDYGYIGALAVFTMLSNTLVESGFTAALVRRKGNTDQEYTAALIFNVVISLVLYAVLYFSAGAIAEYYHMPPLKTLARVLFLAIIINSLTIVQTIILQQKLQFKKLTIANLSGMVASSVIVLWMAFEGYGYWAVAAQQISQVLFKALMLWILSKWHPVRIAWSDFNVIKEIFKFSTLLIVSSFYTTIVRYLYTMFIGPRYSTEQVGYYSQAFKYHQIPYSVISQSISGVGYPVLSSLNGQAERQMNYIHRIMKMTAFCTLSVMAGFYGVSENFIHVIITDKWLPLLPYLRLLIIAGTMMPFINQYLSLLNVFGKPNLNFLCEFLRNTLIIALLFVMNETIEVMLYGFIIATGIALVGLAILTARLTHYKIIDQIKHILPSVLLGLVMGAVVFYLPMFIHCAPLLQLLLQLTVGVVVYVGLAFVFRMEVLWNLIETIKEKKNAHNKNTDAL